MKIIRIKESEIKSVLSQIIKENEMQQSNYMFFSNLEQIERQCKLLRNVDPSVIDEILNNGHDWADDHISEAKTNMDQVFDFFKNEMDKESQYVDYEDINEGIKKNVATNQKLWKQSLEWAKSRYKVCPSAYCNGAAVKRYNSKGGKWRKK